MTLPTTESELKARDEDLLNNFAIALWERLPTPDKARLENILDECKKEVLGRISGAVEN